MIECTVFQALLHRSLKKKRVKCGKELCAERKRRKGCPHRGPVRAPHAQTCHKSFPSPGNLEVAPHHTCQGRPELRTRRGGRTGMGSARDGRLINLGVNRLIFNFFLKKMIKRLIFFPTCKVTIFF